MIVVKTTLMFKFAIMLNEEDLVVFHRVVESLVNINKSV